VTTAEGRGPLFRLRHRKTTVRWRLTLLYGSLFLVCGAGLLVVTYTLVAHAPITRGPGGVFTTIPPGAKVQFPAPRANINARLPGPLPPALRRVLRSSAGRAVVRFVGAQQRISDLHQLEIESAIALAIMVILSAVLGWLVAGRVLRPLRTITATAQQISEASLHRRLALPGPRDELRQLADTIDGLLERLEGAFDAQRQFVANASHELRTPLTAARALLEMVITDPHASVETFRETCRHVLQENEQQEQLIDALLSLAQGQRGLGPRERINLDAVVTGEVQRQEGDAAARGLQVELSLEPALISGDQRLVRRLVSNLLENAIRHNTQHGEVRVAVEAQAGEPILKIANTGQRIPSDEIDRLLEPFQGLTPDRIGHGDGLGLGLSIVAAVADAHNASLQVKPRSGGGLEVEVRFPHASRDGALIDARQSTETSSTSSPPATEQPTIERVV
jgi:signal transduction histidine kinase